MDCLGAIGPAGHVYAFDQDAGHLAAAADRLLAYERQVTFIHANFSQMQDELRARGVTTVDAILFDLGVALAHFTDAERGFSFQREGPLDMRMNRSGSALVGSADARDDDVVTAATIINESSETDLADIFFLYGEERFSRRIAHTIVERRRVKPFTTTTDLADVVAQVYPARLRNGFGAARNGAKRRGGIHPATRVFQALRIAVNRELEVLESALPQAIELLRPGGRLVVISYHSLEDRIVKHFFRDQARTCRCSPEALRCHCVDVAKVKLITRHAATPGESEVAHNPRSRSAKLRAVERL